jgi:hypothetical protein
MGWISQSCLWRSTKEDEKQLLREAYPLTRNGNQHRFVHRSPLEYGLALAAFDPNDWRKKPRSIAPSSRRGSTGSAYSFRIHGSTQGDMVPADQEPDIDSPLA